MVGAGPAGCAAAIGLARRGVTARVIEAQRFPRDKVCGDVLLPEARATLDHLGVDTAPLAAVAHSLLGCRYHTPSGRTVDLPFRDLDGRGRPWWVIPRRTLDAWLVEQVRALGVTVEEGVRATDLIVGDGAVAGVAVGLSGRRREERRARVVLAADGASSALSRAAGLYERPPPHVSVAIRGYAEAGVAGEGDLLQIFTTERTLPGCGWLVPMGSGLVNIGVGVIAADVRRRRDRLGALGDALAERHPAFSEVWVKRPPLRGWSLPGASGPAGRVRAGLLLLGDAGAMVDPFTGHGIHTALAAGQLAARVVASALDQGDVGREGLASFDLLWRRRYGVEMGLGWLLQRLCASRWRVEALVRYVSRASRRRDLVGGLIGHAYPRRALLRPATLLGGVRQGGEGTESA